MRREDTWHTRAQQLPSLRTRAVIGIASLGLVTIHAEAGRHANALRGYQDLLGYWERTGNWIQMWTTLRNLAVLLARLGYDERAAYLEAAADQAPDAPAVSDAAWPARRATQNAACRLEAGRVWAASTSRAEVVDVARRAIEENLAGIGRSADSHLA